MMIVSGYAALYGSLSKDLGGWRERIEWGAFRQALRGRPDIKARVGHMQIHALGSTREGTLELWEDKRGLGYRTQVPESCQLEVRLQLSDWRTAGSSFAFSNNSVDDSWHLDQTNNVVRVLHQVRHVEDVGPTDSPAYPHTTAHRRQTP